MLLAFIVSYSESVTPIGRQLPVSQPKMYFSFEKTPILNVTYNVYEELNRALEEKMKIHRNVHLALLTTSCLLPF